MNDFQKNWEEAQRAEKNLTIKQLESAKSYEGAILPKYLRDELKAAGREPWPEGARGELGEVRRERERMKKEADYEQYFHQDK